MNRTIQKFLVLSVILFSAAQANASIYAKEGVYVLDSTGRYMDLFKKNFQRFTLDHPEHQGFRHWLLLTADAQPVYRQCGFATYIYPERVMTFRPDSSPPLAGATGPSSTIALLQS